jgi:hypothetical protein
MDVPPAERLAQYIAALREMVDEVERMGFKLGDLPLLRINLAPNADGERLTLVCGIERNDDDCHAEE